MLEVLDSPSVDPLRLRRLLVAGTVGVAVMLVGGYAASKFVRAPQPEAPAEEPAVEVSLLEPEEEPPPPPPPTRASEPASLPAAAPPRPAAAAPPRTVTAPSAPKTAPADYDDDRPTFHPGNGQGDGTGAGGEKGGTGGQNQSVAPPPPPPPEPKPPPPKRAPEPTEYDPPKCKRRGIDAAQAKALGVSGKVIVTYTVTATGEVVNVTAQSGPTALQPLAVAAVSAWKCEPARMKEDGKAIAVTKKVPLNVSVETSP
ncbi:MAG: TonB family protein [Polyangiaceae bacterium]